MHDQENLLVNNFIKLLFRRAARTYFMTTKTFLHCWHWTIVDYILSELESGKNALVGLNWKRKMSLFAMLIISNKSLEGNLKKMKYYFMLSITEKFIKLFVTESEESVTKNLPSFCWKGVLISQWWCKSKRADFTFVFKTRSR